MKPYGLVARGSNSVPPAACINRVSHLALMNPLSAIDLNL